jgi:hypothetical protein
MKFVRSGHDLVAVAHIGDQTGVVRRARLIEMVASDALANGSVIDTNSHRGELGANMPSLFLSPWISRTDLLTGAAP